MFPLNHKVFIPSPHPDANLFVVICLQVLQTRPTNLFAACFFLCIYGGLSYCYLLRFFFLTLVGTAKGNRNQENVNCTRIIGDES